MHHDRRPAERLRAPDVHLGVFVGQHDHRAVDRHLGVADPAARLREPHRLDGAERLPGERERAGSVPAAEIRSHGHRLLLSVRVTPP
jgi:hypothetical protein